MASGITKRFPRKAKKWAKKNRTQLISVNGKRMWYSRDYSRFYVGKTWYEQ